MSKSDQMRGTLDGAKVIVTATQLTRRIEERFPGSGLAQVGARILETARETQSEIDALQRPIWSLRAAALFIAAFSATLLFYLMLGGIQWGGFSLPHTFTEFIALLEPTLGSVVFLTAYFVFVASLERRWKERRVLETLTKLRSAAHVIDMHQLTKDPERYILSGPDTASSPSRTLTPFELGRYLDYCSELLSILGKISALWAQAFAEPNLLAAVDQVENLTTSLSRKIWQKLMVLESVASALHESAKARENEPSDCPDLPPNEAKR